MRAIEDADETPSRASDMGAPEEIVRQLLLTRGAEGGDRDTEWSRLVEHVAYGAVFARSIDALQHNQERALALRVELVLPFVDNGAVLCALLFGCLAVWEGRGVGSIELAEMDTGTRLSSKLGCEIFCHGSVLVRSSLRDCYRVNPDLASYARTTRRGRVSSADRGQVRKSISERRLSRARHR